jgi:hypothetical protein
VNDFLKEYGVRPDTRPDIIPGRTWVYLKDREGNGAPVSLGRDQLRHLIADLSAASKKLEDAAEVRAERNATEDWQGGAQ